MDIEWEEDINGCYDPPNDQYNFPDHLYVRDTESIIFIKEAASGVSYNKVKSKIAAWREYVDEQQESDCDSDDMSHRSLH